MAMEFFLKKSKKFTIHSMIKIYITGWDLKNVYERIRIYYGEKADLKIESELDDSGTKITIVIPVEGALKNEEE
jgi:sensor histidine kinase YesM